MSHKAWDEDDTVQDWDAEVAEEEEEVDEKVGQVYTFESANGMVTIKPVGGHSAFARVPPIEHHVWWYGRHAKYVAVHTSFDDFQTPFALGRDDLSEPFTGILRLPPGRYLMRFNVDGQWMVDENDDVIVSLGNEYNSLEVVDPEAESDEDTSSDDDDWAELDNQLDKKARESSHDSTLTLFPNLQTKSTGGGMATISPEEFKKVASQMQDIVEDAEFDVPAEHRRRRSTTIQWDAAKGTLYVEEVPDKKKPKGDKPKLPKTESQKAAKREKRRKRRQKLRMKKARQRALGQVPGATKPHVDAQTLQAEVLQREKQWKEAWLKQEEETRKAHENELERMRASWNTERNSWIEKIKKYVSESNELRAKNNTLLADFEKAQSDQTLIQNKANKEISQCQQKMDELNDQVSQYKALLAAAKEDFKANMAQSQQSNQHFEAKISELEKSFQSAKSNESKLKVRLESANALLADLQKELKEKEQGSSGRLADKEEQIKALEADKKAKEAELSALSKSLNDKLNQHISEAEAARNEVSALKSQLAEAKRACDAVTAEKADLEQSVKAAKEHSEEQQAKISRLNEKMSELTTLVSQTRGDADAKVTALEEQLQAANTELSSLRIEVVYVVTIFALDQTKQDQASYGEAASKQIAKLEAQIADLQALDAKHKEQLAAAKTELKDTTAQLQATQQEFDAKKAELEKQVSELKESECQLKRQIESAIREKEDLQTELKEKSDAHSTSVAERDARIKSLEADKQAKEAELATANKASEEAIAKHKHELATAQSETGEVKSQLSETKRTLDALSASKAGVEENLKVAEETVAANEKKIASLNEKLTEAAAKTQKIQSQFEAKIAESEAKASKLEQEIASKQKELNETEAELSKVKESLQLQEAKFAREAEEFKRQLAESAKQKEAITKVTLTVAQSAKDLRGQLKELSDQQSSAVHEYKSASQDNRKFILQAISTQSQFLAQTLKKYKKEMSERRKYFNLVQELRGNIRVFCRVRPVIAYDKKRGDTTVCVSFPDDNVVKVVADKRENEYEFDRVFGMDSTQQQIFDDTRDLIHSCMDGYNVCIFAYGQTGSGKTFTMQGDSKNPGLYFSALNELFDIRDERKGDFSYEITVSMIEIYNEKIRDLLSKTPPDEQELKVRKGANGMYIEGLTENAVDNESDVLKAMEIGNSNRATFVTNMNEHSSRSHALLTVNVVGQNLTAGVTYYGKLHLIDLAGSERVGKSQATGQRLKEAQAINKSLSALGNVIESLQQKTPHVPYRDSKLTYLLQDSLGGHAKTLMFIQTSSCLADAPETFCSLEFALRVRQVELGAAVKTMVKEAPKKK